MEDRHFSEETLRLYGVGYVPKSKIDYVKHKFLTPSELDRLVELKHLYRTGKGQYTDKFAGRLMFPVRDSRGKVLGFAGRSVYGELPKYDNSAESTAYHKARCVYGLDLAKKYIYSADKAVFCEGYTDAMAFYQTGVKNAVAAGGTHATKQQLALIARYTENIYLAFDADDAGGTAQSRTEQYARDMGLRVGKVNLPEGKDPADVLLK